MNQNLIIDLTPETLSKNQNEFKRFLAVIQSMESYGPDTLKEASKMEKDFEIINSKYPYPKYPFNYKERITRLKQAIELNQSFLNELIKIYKPPPSYYVGIDFDEIKHSRFDEQKFIINILIYTMRDWAKEREEERKNLINLCTELKAENNRLENNLSMAQQVIENGNNFNNNLPNNKIKIENGGDYVNKIKNENNQNEIINEKYINLEMIKKKARSDAELLLKEREKNYNKNLNKATSGKSPRYNGNKVIKTANNVSLCIFLLI